MCIPNNYGKRKNVEIMKMQLKFNLFINHKSNARFSIRKITDTELQ